MTSEKEQFFGKQVSAVFAGGKISGEVIAEDDEQVIILAEDLTKYPVLKTDLLKDGETVTEHIEGKKPKKEIKPKKEKKQKIEAPKLDEPDFEDTFKPEPGEIVAESLPEPKAKKEKVKKEKKVPVEVEETETSEVTVVTPKKAKKEKVPSKYQYPDPDKAKEGSKIWNIIQLFKKGKSIEQIVAAGYHKNTVATQIKQYCIQHNVPLPGKKK